MSTQRVLLTAAPPAATRDWRAIVDWLQAAAAFDHPLELAACGDGLRWLASKDAAHMAAIAALSSLTTLEVGSIRVPKDAAIRTDETLFELARLDAAAWQRWLRQASLQVLT